MYIAHIWGVRLPAAPMPKKIWYVQARMPHVRMSATTHIQAKYRLPGGRSVAQDVAVDVGEGRLGDVGAPGDRPSRTRVFAAHACPLIAAGFTSGPRTTFFR